MTVGMCLSTGSRAGAQAAPRSSDPLDVQNSRTADPFSTGSSDPLAARGSDQYSAFFNLMHRMQLGTIRSTTEFNQDQQQSIGSEASDFRSRQRQQLLKQQNQAVPSQAVSAPTGSSVGGQ
jgi:hypothetical protein